MEKQIDALPIGQFLLPGFLQAQVQQRRREDIQAENQSAYEEAEFVFQRPGNPLNLADIKQPGAQQEERESKQKNPQRLAAIAHRQIPKNQLEIEHRVQPAIPLLREELLALHGV